MTILTASDVGHAFGAQDLFAGASMTLDRRDRVGLVGPNGVGKTTLLLILAGLLEPTTGSVARAQGLRLGYLRQEAVLTFAGQDNTVWEEMLTVFAGAARSGSGAARAGGGAWPPGQDPDELFDAYGVLQEAYDLGGGYPYQHRYQARARRPGLRRRRWQTPLAHLSGGQKTRVLLGRLLLETPDLLILDEPTNHLDMAAVQWLEQTLRQWPGALIIVSHDRYFLDRVVSGIWAMAAGRRARLSRQLQRLCPPAAQEWAREAALFAAEKARLEAELDFIRRNIAGGKADMATRQAAPPDARHSCCWNSSAYSRKRTRAGWRLAGGCGPSAPTKRRGACAPCGRPTGRSLLNSAWRPANSSSAHGVLRTRDLIVGYPDEPLFAATTIKLERYDCAALIGPNGSGKSTLLRTILGELEPLAG